jgi:acyl carrier protein
MKIPGDRIELVEVDSALSAHESIKQSCVVMHDEGGSTHLVAYYVSSNSEVTVTELRKFLAEKLRQDMIPTQFVPMNSFPRTPNGEVDRTALPKPSLEVRSDPAREAATSELEQTIIVVWREFLGVGRIGSHDNFFDLGGDSLLLVRVHTRLQEALRIKLSITDLFEFSTVRSLAHHLSDQVSPGSFSSDVQQRAQQQRAAFARQRKRQIGSAT